VGKQLEELQVKISPKMNMLEEGDSSDEEDSCLEQEIEITPQESGRK